MPNLNIYLPAGIDEARRHVLLRRVTDVVAETLAAPVASIRLFLFEVPASHICVAGIPLDAAGADADGLAGPTVHAHLVAGRSEASKAAFIEGVSRVLAEVLDIAVTPVRIMIVDIPNTDFGLGGRTAKALGR